MNTIIAQSLRKREKEGNARKTQITNTADRSSELVRNANHYVKKACSTHNLYNNGLLNQSIIVISLSLFSSLHSIGQSSKSLLFSPTISRSSWCCRSVRQRCPATTASPVDLQVWWTRRFCRAPHRQTNSDRTL